MFKKLFSFGKKNVREDEQTDVEETINEENEQAFLEETADNENETLKEIDESDTIIEETGKTETAKEVEIKPPNNFEPDEEKFEYTEVTDEILEKDSEENKNNAKQVEKSEKKSLFQKFKDGLNKTARNITGKIDIMLGNYTKIDDEMMEELEEILITSDIGFETTVKIIDTLKENLKNKHIDDVKQVKPELRLVIKDIMTQNHTTLTTDEPPYIYTVIGVNGVGKTTSIGKIAALIKKSGKSVMLAAADTFRAAATEQLTIWADRSQVDIIKREEGTDPSAVIYDAIKSAQKNKTDVLICDTAGRLHNRKNLMAELGKIFKIIDREYPEAKKETLLVIDATTGQNAISQVKVFKEVAPITGIILTKLDGTAKGGVVIAITDELKVPVKYVGVGEGIDDLQIFDPENFAKLIISEE